MNDETVNVDALSQTMEVKIIAAQNDAFRKLVFTDESVGRWVISAGVHARGIEFEFEAISKVKSFAAFTEDCDPYGTHEMGAIAVQGETVWFKIDLYDANYEWGSPEPAEVTKTRRVLTILFPSEY